MTIAFWQHGHWEGIKNISLRKCMLRKQPENKTLDGLTTACTKREIYAARFGKTSRPWICCPHMRSLFHDREIKHFVYRKIGGKGKKVRTCLMHLQYTCNMKGVDATDQLWDTYSCITQSHKWWHRLFSYMLDTTINNMWIIHSDLRFRFLEEPLTHLSFQLQLANELSSILAG